LYKYVSKFIYLEKDKKENDEINEVDEIYINCTESYYSYQNSEDSQTEISLTETDNSNDRYSITNEYLDDTDTTITDIDANMDADIESNTDIDSDTETLKTT